MIGRPLIRTINSWLNNLSEWPASRRKTLLLWLWMIWRTLKNLRLIIFCRPNISRLKRCHCIIFGWRARTFDLPFFSLWPEQFMPITAMLKMQLRAQISWTLGIPNSTIRWWHLPLPLKLLIILRFCKTTSSTRPTREGAKWQPTKYTGQALLYLQVTSWSPEQAGC